MKKILWIVVGFLMLTVPVSAYFGTEPLGQNTMGTAAYGDGAFGEKVSTGGPSGAARLLEDGTYRLLEDGTYRLLE